MSLRPGGDPAGSPRAAAILIVLVAALVFLPAGDADYVQDDHVAVEESPVVARGDVSEIFTSSYWKGTAGDDRSLYRPVAVLSHALERRAVGSPNAAVSHGVNAALHAATSGLLFALALRLGVGPLAAIAASLLFALHPGHSEAVLSVVGRAEILAAAFTLGALRAHLATGAESRGRKRLASWIAAACVLLGLGSKEVAIAAPALMLSLDLLLRTSTPGRLGAWLLDRAGALVPSAVAVLLYLGLRVFALESFPALQRIPPSDNYLVLLEGAPLLASALAVAARWAETLLWPLRLSADYSGYSIPQQDSPWAPLPLLGLLFLLSIAALAVAPVLAPRRASRTLRLASFSALLFLLPYFVVSNFPIRVGAIFAERLTYLPSAGLALLIGLGYEALRGRLRQIATAALGVVLVACALRTWTRASEWQSDETVFGAVVSAGLPSPRAHFIVGKLRGEQRPSVEALSHLEEALRHWPVHVPARFEKGVLLGRIGDLAGAETAFREVLRINPGYGAAHYNLGHTLRLGKRGEEAERSLRKAVLWEPDHARAWAELGHLRFEEGRYTPAAEAYDRAVGLGRQDLEARREEARRRATGAP